MKNEIKFRLLEPSDIDCRAAQVSQKRDGTVSAFILLYKDARVDQSILDETFGIFGWKRSHQLIGDRLYCTVEVKDPDTGEWIAKQDVGTESNTEKEKGQASDSFKRACFNFGIGRELYSAPKINIVLNEKEYYTNNSGKIAMSPYCGFSVKSIEYDERRNISGLVIVDDKGHERYRFGAGVPKPTPKPKAAATTPQAPAGKPQITDAQFEKVMARLGKGEKSLIDKVRQTYTLTEEQTTILKQYE